MPTNPEHEPAHSYRDVLRERMRDPTPDVFLPGAVPSMARLISLGVLTAVFVAMAGMHSATAGVAMLYVASFALFLVGIVVRRVWFETNLVGTFAMTFALLFHESMKF